MVARMTSTVANGMQTKDTTKVNIGSVPSETSLTTANATGNNSESNNHLAGIFQSMLVAGRDVSTSFTAALTVSATTRAFDSTGRLRFRQALSVPKILEKLRFCSVFRTFSPSWQFGDYSLCISARANFHMLFGHNLVID